MITAYCQGAWRDEAGVIHHAAGCDLPHGSAPDASHVTSAACREIFRRWFRGEDIDSEGRAQAAPLQGGKAGDSTPAARAPLSESQEAAA